MSRPRVRMIDRRVLRSDHGERDEFWSKLNGPANRRRRPARCPRNMCRKLKPNSNRFNWNGCPIPDREGLVSPLCQIDYRYRPRWEKVERGTLVHVHFQLRKMGDASTGHQPLFMRGPGIAQHFGSVPVFVAINDVAANMAKPNAVTDVAALLWGLTWIKSRSALGSGTDMACNSKTNRILRIATRCEGRFATDRAAKCRSFRKLAPCLEGKVVSTCAAHFSPCLLVSRQSWILSSALRTG